MSTSNLTTSKAAEAVDPLEVGVSPKNIVNSLDSDGSRAVSSTTQGRPVNSDASKQQDVAQENALGPVGIDSFKVKALANLEVDPSTTARTLDPPEVTFLTTSTERALELPEVVTLTTSTARALESPKVVFLTTSTARALEPPKIVSLTTSTAKAPESLEVVSLTTSTGNPDDIIFPKIQVPIINVPSPRPPRYVEYLSSISIFKC